MNERKDGDENLRALHGSSVTESDDYAKAIESLTRVLTGMSIAKAKLLLSAHGWSLRIMRTEKGHCIGTCDFNPGRFNVAVKGDTVMEILSVG